MIQEINHRNLHSSNLQNTQMYSFKDIQISDEKSILIYFLKHLTFDATPNIIWDDLSSEQVVQLRDFIDKIYTCYKSKKRTKIQVQGLWPLLSFSFKNRNGLSLYLFFEKIIQPELEIQQIEPSEVKQEYIQFNPKRYFRKNNQWINDKQFLQAITVLQTYNQGLNIQTLRKFCISLFQSLYTNVDYLCICREFQQKYNSFKAKVIRSSKQTIINKIIFNDRFCNQNVVFSEPDAINTLQYFTKNQFLLNQSYSKATKDKRKTIITKHELLVTQPYLKFNRYEQKCKTVIQQIQDQQQQIQECFMVQAEHSQPTSTVSIPKHNRQTTYSKSSATKKIVTYQRDNSLKKHQRVIKRIPRNKFIQKLYQVQDKKNSLLQQLKKQRKKQAQIKKKNKKIQRIHRINYYSDQEEMLESSGQPNKKSKRRRRMQIESPDQESRYSLPDHSINNHHHYEQTQRKSNKKQYNRPKLQKKSAIYRQDQDYFVVPDEQFQQQSFSMEYPNQRTGKSVIQNINVLNKKKDPYLQYLNNAKTIRTDRKSLEPISNMDLRKFNLDQRQSIVLTIDIHAYLLYLASLQNQKQIRKQVFSVAKQFTTLRQSVLNIDIAAKIVALFVASQDKVNPTLQIWFKYQKLYIRSMLKFFIDSNVYYTLSQIINNLFVSYYNEDLSILARFKQFLTVLLNITRRFNPSIEQKLVELIYQALTKKLKQESRYQQSYLILGNPFILGEHNMNLALSQSDKQIALMIASFLFDKLFLSSVIRQEQHKHKQQQYLQHLIKLIKSIINNQNSRKNAWIYSFIGYLKKYHQIYKPLINQLYFKKIVTLIGISTNQLSIDLINSRNTQEDTLQINKHVQFLRYVFKEYIEYEFSMNQSLNCLQLLNKLIISNQLKNTYQQPKNNLCIIIYSNILSLIMAFPQFKYNSAIQNNFFKYPSQKLKPNLDQIISKLNLDVNVSVFSIIYAIYSAKITQKITEENQSFSMICTASQTVTETSNKYEDIRKIIEQIYLKIDRKYEQILQFRRKQCDQYHTKLNNKQTLLQYQKRMQDMDHVKSALSKCQQTLSLFLDIFILNPQLSSFDNKQYNSRPSISHFYFVMQFMVNQNFFIKYFVNKFKTANTDSLAQKYCQIIQYWLTQIPNYSTFCSGQITGIMKDYECIYRKNQQLSKWFFFILFSSKTFKKQDLYQTVNILQNKYLLAVSHIYGINLIGSLQIIQKRSTSHQSIILKYLQQSVNISNISIDKIQKSIIFLNNLFSQILNYIIGKQKDVRGSNQKIVEIRKYLAQKNIAKWAKQILIITIIGFCLKNLTQYNELPLQKLILNFKNLRFVQYITDLQKNGLLYFIAAIQKSQKHDSITDILIQFSNLLPNMRESKELSSSTSKMLLEVQAVLKKLQDKSKQKWYITLQTIKILTFILSRQAELDIDCIRKYLVEMQIASNGGSLLCKMKMNQRTMLVLIRLFHQIQILKVNPYQIKSTRDRYIDQMCPKKFPSQQNQNENLKQMVNIFISLRQCLNKNPDSSKIAEPFLLQLIKAFCEPMLSLNQGINLSRRLDIYLQMMENAHLQRRVYQTFFIINKDKFRRLINLTAVDKAQDLSEEIRTFQNVILRCMIGQNSDFCELHKLVSPLIDKSDNKIAKTEIIQKFLENLQKTRGNCILIAWAKQKLEILNKNQENVNKKTMEDYSQWMDIQF